MSATIASALPEEKAKRRASFFEKGRSPIATAAENESALKIRPMMDTSKK